MKNVPLCLLVCSLPGLAQPGVETTQGDVPIRAFRIPATVNEIKPDPDIVFKF